MKIVPVMLWQSSIENCLNLKKASGSCIVVDKQMSNSIQKHGGLVNNMEKYSGEISKIKMEEFSEYEISNLWSSRV